MDPRNATVGLAVDLIESLGVLSYAHVVVGPAPLMTLPPCTASNEPFPSSTPWRNARDFSRLVGLAGVVQVASVTIMFGGQSPVACKIKAIMTEKLSNASPLFRIAKHPAVLAGLGVLIAWQIYTWSSFTQEAQVKKLAKDEIIILRTPGGMLEVSTLVKNEGFGWSTTHTCPLISCGSILGSTVTEIRVPVHYTYRIPLAQSWALARKNSVYELTVPNEQPAVPAAVDLTQMEMRTSSGWLSPSVKENRESLLQHLGPELAQRSTQQHYIDAQRPQARRTVAEFAAKWMVQQGFNPIPADAIKVRFADEGASSR